MSPVVDCLLFGMSGAFYACGVCWFFWCMCLLQYCISPEVFLALALRITMKAKNVYVKCIFTLSRQKIT